MEFEFQWKTFGDQGNQKKKNKKPAIYFSKEI